MSTKYPINLWSRSVSRSTAEEKSMNVWLWFVMPHTYTVIDLQFIFRYSVWKLPEVEKIPPMMPHNLTRNTERGICSSLTLTINGLSLYLIKIPDTPWLPFSWLITRSYMTGGNMINSNTLLHWYTCTGTHITYPFCNRKLVHVHWNIWCVQLGGNNCDKILKQHVLWKHRLRTLKLLVLYCIL